MGLLEARCAATAEALSERLEGELHGLRRLRVSRHLGRCPRCRATLASLVRLVNALRTSRDDDPHGVQSVAERVVARVGEGSRTNAGG